jgi:hypothetical protein
MNTSSSERLKLFNQEVALLRSFVIGLDGKDDEGNYNPEYVRRVLTLARKPNNTSFKSKKGFLKLIS